VKNDHTASIVGVYGLYPVKKHQQDTDKEMQNSDNSQPLTPVDLMTPIIFKVCV